MYATKNYLAINYGEPDLPVVDRNEDGEHDYSIAPLTEFIRDPVKTKDLKEFLLVSDPEKALAFFQKHGPLFFDPPHYAHRMPNQSAQEHHAALTLNAAEQMRKIVKINEWVNVDDNFAKRAHELAGLDIELMSASKEYSDNDVSSILGSNECLIRWVPDLSDEYRSWLGSNIKNHGTVSNIDVEFQVIAKTGNTRTAFKGLIDYVFSKHLRDVAVLREDDTTKIEAKNLITALWLLLSETLSDYKIHTCAYAGCNNTFLVYKGYKKKYCCNSCKTKASILNVSQNK